MTSLMAIVPLLTSTWWSASSFEKVFQEDLRHDVVVGLPDRGDTDAGLEHRVLRPDLAELLAQPRFGSISRPRYPRL